MFIVLISAIFSCRLILPAEGEVVEEIFLTSNQSEQSDEAMDNGGMGKFAVYFIATGLFLVVCCMYRVFWLGHCSKKRQEIEQIVDEHVNDKRESEVTLETETAGNTLRDDNTKGNEDEIPIVSIENADNIVEDVATIEGASNDQDQLHIATETTTNDTSSYGDV